MERITIIGMGIIGASLGLALKGAKLKDTEIVGHPFNRDVTSAVKELNAFDKLESQLEKAVLGAQLVIIDANLGDTKYFLESLGNHLRDGSVITDTGTAKKRISAWAEEFLPSGISYIASRPIFSESGDDIKSARSDLFAGKQFCIIPAASASEQSVKTIVGLAETLDAKPYFLDQDEHDSYTAAMDYLPAVLSNAFVNATTASRSWKEMYKTAGKLFDAQSNLSSKDPVDTEIEYLAISDPLVYWIDQVIESLESLKTDISDGNDHLVESLITAWEERARWQSGAVERNQQDVTLPGAGESMASALLGDKLAQRMTLLSNPKKKDQWRYPRS